MHVSRTVTISIVTPPAPEVSVRRVLISLSQLTQVQTVG